MSDALRTAAEAVANFDPADKGEWQVIPRQLMNALRAALAAPQEEPRCGCSDAATLADRYSTTWDGKVLHSRSGCYEVSGFRAPPVRVTAHCEFCPGVDKPHGPGEEPAPPPAPESEERCQECGGAGGKSNGMVGWRKCSMCNGTGRAPRSGK